MAMNILLPLFPAAASRAQYDLNMEYSRSTMVHLFEWNWADIAEECESFLGPYGYGGVQVSPPQEHMAGSHVWWDRYQPVSYRVVSKGGDENAFRDMVNRCNNVGVRIYVDAVINHMAAGGSSMDSSPYNAAGYEFPGVPFSSWDFNVPNGKCPNPSGRIDNYGYVDEVRNCNLLGLTDLDMSKSYVRGMIADYLNYLISMGVAGFRIDAVKHMWPWDLEVIVDSLDNLNSGVFGLGKRPFIVQEVIDMGGGEPITAGDYTHIGRVTEFKYSAEIGNAAQGGNQLKWLSNFGESWGFMSRDHALVFVDNHDNQRNHGGGGNIVTYKSIKQYKIASAFMLGYDYGATRVMSSFQFTDTDIGPPYNSPYFTADDGCDWNSGWVCEHRWREIRNMVDFRNTCVGQGVNNWWDNGNNQVAFSRGSKGFIAINGDTYDLNQAIYTGMPSGTYCDVISGDKSWTSCTGGTVYVNSSGFANIYIGRSDGSPIVAIHTDSKL